MYHCPLDCGYTANSARSIEAHISGKSDDVHRGEQGRNWREQIQATASDGTAESSASTLSPENTEQQTTSENETPTEGDSSSGSDATPRDGVQQDDRVEMTESEFNEIIKRVKTEAWEAGHQDGYNEGYAEAKEELASGETTDSCCSSPDLAGGAGSAFELDQPHPEYGKYVRLDAGEKICLNCETIREVS